MRIQRIGGQCLTYGIVFMTYAVSSQWSCFGHTEQSLHTFIGRVLLSTRSKPSFSKKPFSSVSAITFFMPKSFADSRHAFTSFLPMPLPLSV